MKKPIKWHQECIRNSLAYADRLEREARQYLAIADRIRNENKEALEQIAEAERRGLTEFDRDKFLKPRKQRQSK